MTYHCEILMTEFVTHDIKRFILNRPAGFDFEPGQGVELAIDQPDWREQRRPFTPTSIPTDRVLEFTIKSYPQHEGVTRELHRLQAGDKLLMSEPFGTINYHGPGVFIAAGAGITPFISILRMLHTQQQLNGNSLIFSNKAPQDIPFQKELTDMLGQRAGFVCSRQDDCHCTGGRIDRAYLEKVIDDFTQNFYVCGPPPFTEAINQHLSALGAKPDALIFER